MSACFFPTSMSQSEGGGKANYSFREKKPSIVARANPCALKEHFACHDVCHCSAEIARSKLKLATNHQIETPDADVCATGYAAGARW